MGRTLHLVAVLAALGSAVVGGALYAFSAFVMPGLDRAGPGPAVAAMQGINESAVRAPFMVPFAGTAVLAALLLAVGLLRRDRPGGWWLAAGGLLYLVGVFAVTAGYHVPRNDALAAVDPAGPQAAAAWADYLRSWTVGNHVRAAASLAAAGAFVAALVDG